MKALAPLMLCLVACGPVEEAPTSDSILRAGHECTTPENVSVCSGVGQESVTCFNHTGTSRWVAGLPCVSRCDAPGDYCDLGPQDPSNKCVVDACSTDQRFPMMQCLYDGRIEASVYLTNYLCVACETRNGKATCTKMAGMP